MSNIIHVYMILWWTDICIRWCIRCGASIVVAGSLIGVRCFCRSVYKRDRIYPVLLFLLLFFVLFLLLFFVLSSSFVLSFLFFILVFILVSFFLLSVFLLLSSCSILLLHPLALCSFSLLFLLALCPRIWNSIGRLLMIYAIWAVKSQLGKWTHKFTVFSRKSIRGRNSGGLS